MRKIALILMSGAFFALGMNQTASAQKDGLSPAVASATLSADEDAAVRQKMDMLAGYNSLLHKEFKTLFTGKNFRLVNINIMDHMNGMNRTERVIEFSEDLKKWYPADLSRDEIQMMSKSLSMIPELKEKIKPTTENEISYATKSGFKIGIVSGGGVWSEFVEITKNGITTRLKMQAGNVQELSAVSMKAADY